MLGRDKLRERGQLPSVSSSNNDAAMTEATQCVAKFAPYGQPKMNKQDQRKSITACKLGVADPNELLVSWMGDYIYSFNIIKDQTSSPPKKFSTDAQDIEGAKASQKKRKRVATGESPSNGPSSRPRTSTDDDPGSDYGIIVRVGGGVTSWPPIDRDTQSVDPDSGTGHAQRVRSLKNSLSRSHFAHDTEERHEEMLEILLAASEAYEKVDEHIAHRTYPITHQSSAVDYELKLRGDRAKIWRFCQASGTLARVLLGYRTQPVTDARAQSIDFEPFETIRPAPRENANSLDRHEQFGFDFVKAVLLWLDSGIGAVLREFSPDSQCARNGNRSRLPVPRDAGVDALDTHLIPYLERLAADLPIEYSGHGGRTDDPRNRDEIFSSEKQAVRALSRAMKLQFSDLQGAAVVQSAQASDEDDNTTPMPIVQSRDAAIRFWGYRVCMAVLTNASIDVNYSFVLTAFVDAYGRPNRPHSSVRAASKSVYLYMARS